MANFLFILGFMLVAEVLVIAILLPLALYGTQIVNYIYKKVYWNSQRTTYEDTAYILSGLSGNGKDIFETHMRKRES